MCFLLGTNMVFISQKTPFFIVTAVKPSNPKDWQCLPGNSEEGLQSSKPKCACRCLDPCADGATRGHAPTTDGAASCVPGVATASFSRVSSDLAMAGDGVTLGPIPLPHTQITRARMEEKAEAMLSYASIGDCVTSARQAPINRTSQKTNYTTCTLTVTCRINPAFKDTSRGVIKVKC
jgi:hypothetical protein